MSRHPSPEALVDFMDGRLSRRDNARVVGHLLSGCRECREVTGAGWARIEEGLRAARGEIREAEIGMAAASPRFDATLERAFEVVRRSQVQLARERSEAPGLIERLACHPHPRQITLVRNSRRFQTWGLCELLLQRSWDLRFDNPRTGAELAQLGLFVAEALDPDSYEPALLEDLKGRAWGYLGNNRRILSDFRGAREALVESAECLGRGTGDPCERAQLLFVEAALDRSHGCFPEAIQKFDRALAIYRKFSGESDIACILIEKGHTYLRAGKAVVARSCFLDALDLLDPEEDLHFVLAAEHNLVLCLTEVGDHEEAWRRLPRLRELHRELSDQLNRIRLRWLEAKVLLGLERVHEAEAGFLEVRAAFIEEGVAYDVALVSLDLAAIYARCGRFSELRSTAAEALEIVRSRSVHRDAIAAMILFAEAAKLEQVTLGLIREMTSAVTEARTQEQSLRSR